MDAGAFDNIADVDPHPELDPPICRNLRIPLDHCALDLHAYDPTTVFSNLGLNQLSVMSVQPSKGSLVVNPNEAAVPGYIRQQDCHKSAFNLLVSHS